MPPRGYVPKDLKRPDETVAQRRARVLALRDQVRTGTYQVNSTTLAATMMASPRRRSARANAELSWNSRQRKRLKQRAILTAGTQ